MSKVNFNVSTTGGVALVAATAKTVLMVKAAASRRTAVSGVHVSFDGVSGTAVPVLVEIGFITNTGTFTAVTPEETNVDLAGATIGSSAGENATVEPTYSGGMLKEIKVHPQSGYEFHIPFGKEWLCSNQTGIAIRCTAAATVNCFANMDCEE
jgi:hypothetical protein